MSAEKEPLFRREALEHRFGQGEKEELVLPSPGPGLWLLFMAAALLTLVPLLLLRRDREQPPVLSARVLSARVLSARGAAVMAVGYAPGTDRAVVASALGAEVRSLGKRPGRCLLDASRIRLIAPPTPADPQPPVRSGAAPPPSGLRVELDLPAPACAPGFLSGLRAGDRVEVRFIPGRRE